MRGISLVFVLLVGIARADPLSDRLATDDRAELEAAITAIERAPAETPELADALFAAAIRCEETLVDRARALALYERILRDHPDAGASIGARRRVDALRARIGDVGQHAAEDVELARLVADADRLPPTEIARRADVLAARDWPGAPDVALWAADWARRRGQRDDAQARYEAITRRWPTSPQANTARFSGAETALERRDWELAERLARTLPESDPADRVIRDKLLSDAAAGRKRDGVKVLAWIVLALAIAALAASLAEASLRGGRRRPALRPPIEVLFMLPVAAVLAGIAFTTHRLIAPAVIALSGGGLLLAWLSGAALDTLRARGRATRRRATAHVAICVLAIVALLYIVLVRDDLIDLVIETVRFGPE